MATYEDLREQFSQLNKKGQRIQHQTELMTRRLPITRMALETLANGDHAPEVLRIAREALNELNVPGVPPEKQSLFLVADTPTPPVEVVDLRCYRDLLESLAAELDVSTNSDEGPKGSIAVSGLQKVVEGVCGPGANAQALWLRNGMLEMFLREGYLAPLRSCIELDDAVLRATATIPFNGQDLKPDVFAQRLREEHINVAGTADRQFASSGDEADRYRRLQHHYRLMSVDTQQMEYENGIASAAMANARGALEILSKQDHAPKSLKVVCDALDELNTMSESERFRSFIQSVEQGVPIPPVDPLDVRHLQELYEQSDAQRRDAGMGAGGFLGAGLMKSVCSPGADIGAVWLRSALLGVMLKQGVLADWQRGTGLDDAVYRVAATIPLNGLQLEPNVFVQRLREEVGG